MTVVNKMTSSEKIYAYIFVFTISLSTLYMVMEHLLGIHTWTFWIHTINVLLGIFNIRLINENVEARLGRRLVSD